MTKSTGTFTNIVWAQDDSFGKLDLDYKDYVGIDAKYYRQEELVHLKGDSSKLKSIGFEAEYTFETMLDEMVDHWLDFYMKESGV